MLADCMWLGRYKIQFQHVTMLCGVSHWLIDLRSLPPCRCSSTIHHHRHRSCRSPTPFGSDNGPIFIKIHLRGNRPELIHLTSLSSTDSALSYHLRWYTTVLPHRVADLMAAREEDAESRHSCCVRHVTDKQKSMPYHGTASTPTSGTSSTNAVSWLIRIR
jgi:hypothetical protein